MPCDSRGKVLPYTYTPHMCGMCVMRFGERDAKDVRLYMCVCVFRRYVRHIDKENGIKIEFGFNYYVLLVFRCSYIIYNTKQDIQYTVRMYTQCLLFVHFISSASPAV